MENIKNLTNKLKDKLFQANQEQETLSRNLQSPRYIAHGTHVSPEEFRNKINADIFSQHPNSEGVLPKFVKETQNELDIIKDFISNNSEMDVFKGKDLQEILAIPERVFGIPTKNDLDANGQPIPQDGSYAYAIKKASSSINFTENNIPLLVGTEEGYKQFEEGTQKGHIYIVSGDSFKPEYDSGGKITEYTSKENAPISHHLEVTPENAMQHNVQFVMFQTEQEAIGWYDSNKSKFSNTMQSDGDRMLSLAEEVKAGRATYINASNRGINPQIEVLRTAERIKGAKAKIANRNSKFNQQSAILDSQKQKDKIMSLRMFGNTNQSQQNADKEAKDFSKIDINTLKMYKNKDQNS